MIKRTLLSIALIAIYPVTAEARDYNLAVGYGYPDNLYGNWGSTLAWDGPGYQGIFGLPDLGDNVSIYPYYGQGAIPGKDANPQISYEPAFAGRLIVNSNDSNLEALVFLTADEDGEASLLTINEYIGFTGTGNFRQSGSPHMNWGVLTLGYLPGSLGTYKMYGGTLTVTRLPEGLDAFVYAPEGLGELRVGALGEGVFNQEQPSTNPYALPTSAAVSADFLTLGKYGTGKGTYNLQHGTLTTITEIIGDAGVGTFNHTGDFRYPATTHFANSLTLGAQASGVGTYNLFSGELTTITEIIGSAGKGTFNQGGGDTRNVTKHLASTLTIGVQAGGIGAYNLNSGGLFSVLQNVGLLGEGTFNHIGGSNGVSRLIVGSESGGIGTYNLANGGLTAALETIGDAGIGIFNQNGGSNTTSKLTLGLNAGGSGTYTLSNGTLNVDNIADGAGQGTFNLNGGTLNLTGSIAVDNFNIANAVNSNSSFTLAGGKTVTATNLALGIGSGSQGAFTLNGGQLNVNTILDGAGQGTFNLDGGTLNLTGSAIAVDRFNIGNAINSNGGFTLAGGKTVTATNLALGLGSGSQGAFTLNGGQLNVNTILDGAGQGTFNLNGGTLNLTGSAIAVDNFNIANAVNSNSSFTLAGGKTLTATNLALGLGSGSQGAFTLNGGQLNVNTILDGAGQGTFNLDSGTLNLTGSAIAVDRFNIGNAANLTLNNGKTLLVNSSFNNAGILNNIGVISGTGTYIQTSGQTINNGSFTQTSIQINGGRLNGTGTITSNVNINGGTFAPGNSIGTSHIVGNIDFNGGVYEAEVDAAGNADLINITGEANLTNGTVTVLPETGNYNFSTDYKILTAAGGLKNTIFNGATSSLDYLNPTLSYDANNVYLTLTRNDVDFTGIAGTPNQVAVSTTLTSLSRSHPEKVKSILNNLILLPTTDSQYALDSLSGVQHTQVHVLMNKLSQQYFQLLLNRGNQSRSVDFALNTQQGFNTKASPINIAYTGNDLASLEVNSDTPESITPDRGWWMRGFGGYGDIDSTSNVSGADYDIAGLAFGVDTKWHDFVIGISGGYSNSRVDPLNGKLDVDSYQIAGYGSWQKEDLYLSAAAGFGYHQTDARRTVVVGTSTNKAKADYDSQQINTILEAGKDILLSSTTTTLTPYFGAQYTHIKTNSFTETGAGTANLNVDNQQDESLRTSIGLRLRHDIITSEGTNISPLASITYVHEHMDNLTQIKADFASAPTTFKVDGSELDRDRLQVGLGVMGQLNERTSLNIGYIGEFANSDHNHNLSATARFIW